MSDRRNCPSCGVDNSQEARYCRHCGVRLPKVTPHGSAHYTPGPTDCPYCGKRIWLKADGFTTHCIHCKRKIY